MKENTMVMKMRPLCVIAEEIVADWKTISPAARHHLGPMLTLISIKEDYYADTARSVVAYFLANASGWRGETARRIKKELTAILDSR